MHVAGVELGGLLEEPQPGVRVHHVLDEGHEVLGQQVPPQPPREDEDELRRLVVVLRGHPPPELGELVEGERLRLVPARRVEEDPLPRGREARVLKDRDINGFLSYFILYSIPSLSKRALDCQS